jgi:hypothetical protein
MCRERLKDKGKFPSSGSYQRCHLLPVRPPKSWEGLASAPAFADTMIKLPLPGGPDERPITTAFPQKGALILQRTRLRLCSKVTIR